MSEETRLADALEKVLRLRARIAGLEANYSDVVAEHENELALRLEAEAENKRLQISYDVQKAATCQFVIVSAEDGPKAVDEGMTKAYQVASEQKSRANDAEAELAALRKVETAWYSIAEVPCGLGVKPEEFAEYLKGLTRRGAKAEAALAALKARRCETCDHRIPPTNCYAAVSCFDGDDGEQTGTPDDFACNRWAARAEEGGDHEL